jgi:hypothetical protein
VIEFRDKISLSAENFFLNFRPPITGLVLLVLVCAALHAQQSQPPSAATNAHDKQMSDPAPDAPEAPFHAFNLPDQEFSIPRYCDFISRGVKEPAALSQVCQFALSLDERLPNVICSQETKRYKSGGLLNKGEMKLQDVVTAQVSYEAGKEHYKDLAVNGKLIHSSAPNLRAAWSTGEFASALLDVFSPRSQASFKFEKTDALNSTPALVFDYEIAPENNELWHVEVGDLEMFPGYGGRIWINPATQHLMRLERGDIKTAATSPVRHLESTIDYADVALGDGSSFTLPVASETEACRGPSQPPCWRSELSFKNWHKFTAKTRILTGDEPSPQ